MVRAASDRVYVLDDSQCKPGTIRDHFTQHHRNSIETGFDRPAKRIIEGDGVAHFEVDQLARGHQRSPQRYVVDGERTGHSQFHQREYREHDGHFQHHRRLRARLTVSDGLLNATSDVTMTAMASGSDLEGEGIGITLSGGATIVPCAACSGGARVDNLGWVTFTVIAPSTGSYSLEVY